MRILLQPPCRDDRTGQSSTRPRPAPIALTSPAAPPSEKMPCGDRPHWKRLHRPGRRIQHRNLLSEAQRDPKLSIRREVDAIRPAADLVHAPRLQRRPHPRPPSSRPRGCSPTASCRLATERSDAPRAPSAPGARHAPICRVHHCKMVAAHVGHQQLAIECQRMPAGAAPTSAFHSTAHMFRGRTPPPGSFPCSVTYTTLLSGE